MLSVMSGSFVPFSRLFVVMYAAVVLIMCSHAARASPAVPISQKRVKYSILRRLNTPQQVPSSAGLLSEQQVQTPADIPSISNHQSYPVQFTQGSFSYSQNSLDNTRPRVKITKLQSGGMRPASSFFTTRSPYEGQSFDRYRISDNTFPQNEGNAGNLYNSNMNLFRYSNKPDSEGEIPTSYSSKIDEDDSAKKLHSVYPSQTGRLQSAQLLTPRGHGSDFKETNQLPRVRVWSGASRMQAGNVLDFTSQPRRGAESLGNSLGVIKRNPSPEKPTSISTFRQNQNSKSKEKMLEHNNIQSYLFEDSPSKVYTVTGIGQKVFRGQSDAASWAQTQSPFGAQEKSRSVSKFNHFTRADPNKQGSEAQISFSRPLVIIYPPPHKAITPTPGFLHRVTAETKNWPNLASAVQSRSQVSRKTFAPPDQENATSREPRQEYKPRQSVKRFSRLDGLTNSERKPVKGMSDPFSTDRTQSTLNERKDFGFRFSSAYPSLSQKYSFGQKRVSATTTTPAKLDTVETYSPSPVTQVSSTSTAQPFTSMLESPQPGTGASINSNENTDNRFRLYKGRFGLKGHGSQPLEGAKALPRSTDPFFMPKPSFKGFELRNSEEVPRPKRIRIHRLYNQRGDNEPGSRGDFKTYPNTARAGGSVPRFTSHQATNKTQTLQGFQPGKNQTIHIQNRISWKYPEQNLVRLSKIASSSHLRSAEPLTDNVSPLPKPRAADGKKPATEEGARFKTPTSRTVRGKRVKLTQTGSRKLIGFIIRNSTRNSVIHRPSGVKSVTYADILGSASFSSVRAPGQHQDNFPNMTIGQEEGWSSKSDDVKNVSRSSEANVTNDKKDLESVERREEADNEVETSDLFFESEGSGSFDLSDVSLSTTENESAGKDLLELDYLRKSTGNISFRSLSKSHLKQR